MTTAPHTMLQRYLNGRFVSFHLDRLLPAFDPFHSGIVDSSGTVPLRFPGFDETYELRLGPSASSSGVVFALDLQLPILAPGFWFCIHCVMRDDYVALISPTAQGIIYAHPDTPKHVPDSDGDGTARFVDHMTRVERPEDLIERFTGTSDFGEQ
ncbi:hypothetical protein [Roseiconus lacunae]|uniref:hypothetical protein n=1 Tax=Roseiconus lacunae TaxID=2605694 RepID=UPI001E604100|nr:hypothetical protein [Roseiconus lacunae]MCD0458593.1 hypothetical protein [Roseiconus lacunae]